MINRSSQRSGLPQYDYIEMAGRARVARAQYVTRLVATLVQRLTHSRRVEPAVLDQLQRVKRQPLRQHG
jgi:hypothetical protein